MKARQVFLLLALAMALSMPASLAQASNIAFADPGLLGASFSAPSGSTGSYALDSYGLSGVTFSLQGSSWYGTNPALWVPGYDPGTGNAAGIYMIGYRGEYGLAVGAQAGTGSLSYLPSTGVNEIDSLEALTVTFNQPVYLSSVTLGNFYNDSESWTGQLEKGWLVFDGNYALPYDFSSPQGQFWSLGSAGTLVITLPTPVVASSVTFMAAHQISGENWSSDYLVRAVDVAKTPEPASLLLMGSAAGLMWWRRRRQA